MKERFSPPLGAYRVRAYTTHLPPSGWLACGQTWIAGSDGQEILLTELSAGPTDSEDAALDQAYGQAYAATLRLVMREFVCL